jgi:hypothetical protein
MISKLEKMWDEALVKLSYHMSGGTEENYEKLISG